MKNKIKCEVIIKKIFGSNEGYFKEIKIIDNETKEEICFTQSVEGVYKMSGTEIKKLSSSIEQSFNEAFELFGIYRMES